MAKRGGFMSEELKLKLAGELGIKDVVESEGWSSIRAKDAGNLVKMAILIAEKQISGQPTNLR